MKKIISELIEWEKLRDKNKDIYCFDVCKAKLDEKKNILLIFIKSNFVIPYDNIKAIEKTIMKKITALNGVKIQLEFDNLIQDKDEAIKFIVPFLIEKVNGEYATWTKTIYTENLRIEEGKLTLYALGGQATEILNGNVKEIFQKIIKEKLGYDLELNFENHEEEYHKIKKENIKIEKEEISNDIKKAKSSNQTNVSENHKGKVWKKADSKKLTEKPVSGEKVELQSVNAESGKIVVEGILFKKDSRSIKNDKKLIMLYISNKKTSLCVKGFVPNDHWDEMQKELKEGKLLRIKGEAQLDLYDNAVVVMASAIEVNDVENRKDNAKIKRVELHAHTKMSAMDGLNEVDKMISTHVKWGHKAVAITDHGVVQAFPEAQHTSEKNENIKVIYGMEGYVFDDYDCIDDEGKIDYKKKKTNHIIILAKNKEGLKNLYKLVSISHMKYFYKKPRLPKSIISQYREGLIIGGACEAGEVFRAIIEKKDEAEIERLVNFYDYLEIQPLVNNKFLIDKGIVSNQNDLIDLNKKVVALGEKYNKLVVATTDAHYAEPEDAIYRNILMAGQGYSDFNGKGLYLRTTDEMIEEFMYLGEEKATEVVVTNTNIVADMIEKIDPIPKEKFPPKIENADKLLRTKCYEKAWSIYGKPLPIEIEERLETEIEPIIREGYAVMYIAAEMLVQKSMSDGYLVGSRGSVGSSFAATMAGITEVNPLPPHYVCPNCKNLEWGDNEEYDCGVDMEPKICPKCGTSYKRDGFSIPFQTFLGFKANKEPDIDLNFAGEYQSTAHKYVDEIFGEKNVYKAGTIGTVADKTAYGFVMKYIEETSLPIPKAEIDRLTQCCTGVKRTTSQHPGGIIIVPDDHEIYEFCPIQYPANDSSTNITTTHFDYHSIDQNLLKLDILGHDVPSIIRHLQDMTNLDPINDVPLSDYKVNSLFTGIEHLNIKSENYEFTHGTYGIPEFGTKFTRQMLDDTQPKRFADFVRISGFSHGTDVWINNAQEWIKTGVATIKDAISTRDDIMNYLIQKGLPKENSFKIMENVRKGKGLKPEEVELMETNNVPEWYIESCRRIKYMFPKAHAVAYVMMAYRIAYFKVYYPAEFYAAYFTTKTADFDINTIMQGEEAIKNKLKMISDKGKNATKKEKDESVVLEVAYEMYARGYEFEPSKFGKSHWRKFYVSEGKVLMPFVVLEGVGENAARSMADEYERRPFDSIEDLKDRAKINKTALEGLRKTDILKGLPESDQMCFFA